jgi:hypothetical protein
MAFNDEPMKRIVLLFVIFTLAGPAKSQDAPNFSEWFRQKKTQIKYLVQQIAALQVYLGYLKKGYEVVDKGLTTVGKIKDGTFDQDKVYLTSLKNVSPVVSNSPQINAILVYQQSIIKAFQNLETIISDNEYIAPPEKEYIRIVHANMLQERDDAIDELSLILTTGETEMKDDERLLRLDTIHEEMLDKYTFTKSFVSSARLLVMQRAKEDHEIRTARKLILKD